MLPTRSWLWSSESPEFAALGQDGRVTATAEGNVPVTTVWRPGRPVDLGATLGPLVRGHGDPTHRFAADGRFWRVARTPRGPATICIGVHAAEVHATAWGDGAEWMIATLPDLLGARDDPTGFDPKHPLLRATLGRHIGLRIPPPGFVPPPLGPTGLR